MAKERAKTRSVTCKACITLAALLLSSTAWAQISAPALLPLMELARLADLDPAQQPVPEAAQPPVDVEPRPQEEPYYIELGGFENFVDHNFGRWSGAQGRIIFRHLKRPFIRHFAPIWSFATQTRPEGSQATFGLDSYIYFNKWFYMIAGVGGSPDGSAVLWPKMRYGATGYATIPGVKGLVGTLGITQIHGEHTAYARIVNIGAMYYHGKAIWSGYLSINRNYPGSIPSESGVFFVQYGAEKKQWIGAGMSGGRIAYQTIALRPLDVRFNTFGPNFFYQKWITHKWGVILRYDYQNEIDAYQRHGVSASLFFEVGPPQR